MNRTSDASVNWTTICKLEVKSGNGKMFLDSPSPFFSWNIHLLYTDSEMEKEYLCQLASYLRNSIEVLTIMRSATR